MSAFLRRYTTIQRVKAVLASRALTLVSPARWADKDDALLMECYRKQRKCKSLLALCFTEASETYHHWAIFAKGSSGMCLEFDKEALLESLKGVSRSGSIEYLKIRELGTRLADGVNLAFIKRLPFRDEREFRVLYESRRISVKKKEVPFRRLALRRIISGPTVPLSRHLAIKSMVNGMKEWAHVEVRRTTLTNNAQWRRIAERVLHGRMEQ